MPAAAAERTPTATQSLLLTAAEAAALCGKSSRTWRSWQSSGSVPRPIRIGRSLLWRREELVAWIAAGCPTRDAWKFRP